MTFYIGLTAEGVDALAYDISARLRAMCSSITTWRADINTASGTDSYRAQESYQQITSTRNYVESKKTTVGLKEAYLRANPGLPPSYDPAAEWATGKVALDSFVTWFQTNWPEKTASGKPAYLQFDATTAEHKSYFFALSAPAKTQLLQRLDAILAAFS